MKLCDIKEHW